jgi:hypothetical protein
MRTALLLSTILLAAGARAGEAADFPLEPPSRLWIEGTSTLHRYTAEAKALKIRSDAPPSSFIKDAPAGRIKVWEVSVRVADLTSGEKGLDKVMRSALKERDCPEIKFVLTGYKTVPGEPLGFAAYGSLTIAGREQEILLPVELDRERDRPELVGSYKLLMTDYGVKPPTFMGLIRADNAVTVRFRLVLPPLGPP